VPSAFFISGFSESGMTPLSPPSTLAIRGNELRYLARLELNRFEFGLQDRSQNRDTQAARDIARALQDAGKLSHPRAKQRAHSYNPREGQEHCPHCWVFVGTKHPLQFVDDVAGGLAETASCGVCKTQYQVPKT
jgi:hypothetical protein